MINKIVLLICALFLPLAGGAQINMVLNPDFEEQNHCPDNYDEAKYATHWMSLDSAWTPPDWAHVPFGVPDYCHVCAPVASSVSIPGGAFYYSYPHSGNGMMQVQMFYDEGYVTGGPGNFRDYLQGHLAHTLVSGNTYSVFFHTKFEQGSYYRINNIGAYFDDGTIDTTHEPGWVQTQYTPQILDTAIIMDTDWVKVSGTFVANGTEKLITISNFTNRAHTHFIAVLDTTGSTAGIFCSSLYLVDDVSVIDCSNVPFAGNDTLIHPGDSVWLGPHEQLLPYTWYVLGSGTPVDSGGGFWVHPTATTTYVLQQRLCETTKYDTVTVNVWPLGVANSTIRQFDNLAMFPNPSAGLLTIEHAEGCEVVFYDVVGREVRRMRAVSDREEVDISAFQGGVYFMHVIDPLSGQQVVKKLIRE